MPAVTVTATVLNEVDDIDGLVSTLAQQTLSPEVIIVDGGSTDGTWERLQAARSRYPNLVAIRDTSCNLSHRRDRLRVAAMLASRRRPRRWWHAPTPDAPTTPSGSAA